MRFARAAVALGCLAGLFVAVGSPPASAVDGLTPLGQTTITSRMTDYRFQTTALSSPTTIRVIFPRNYDASGATRYPVLYLLHGGAANYTSWTRVGGIADILTDGLDLITVMPDAGRSAWYTDWYNNGLGGFPKWETYHIGQLVPWVDANLPTVGNRSGRAIAGLSSGGFGAMSYASRHPDLFVAAAAFSGAVDTNTPPVLAGKVIDGLALQDVGLPGSLFGLRETEEVRWRGHNPWDLAGNLRGMELAVRTGNGMAGGSFGGGGFADPGGFFLERAVHDMSVSFHNRLDSLQIPHVYDNYGPGTHSFPYWNRSLERTLPMFMQTFAEHRPDPSPFSYRSIERIYETYGWRVAMNRSVVEFSELKNVTADGFTLSGSGSATVTSAPIYEPGRTYDVTIAGEQSPVVADGSGRLVLAVPLGPANLTQQYFTPTGDSPATTVHTTEVDIAAREIPQDTTPPTVEISSPSDGEVFVLGEDAAASFSCDDDDSGVATCDGGEIDTSTAGEHVFSVSASDNAGNTASQTSTYRVVYDSEAFLSPIESPPAMNDSNDNRSIPFKWRLRDADGNVYSSLAAEDVELTWTPIDCESRAATGDAVAASSEDGLTYDAEAEGYEVVTRAPGGAAGSCQRFTMRLDDGMDHAADFRFH